MNKQTCRANTYETKEKKFWVHLQNNIWIDKSHDLLSICRRCTDNVKCDTREFLLTLLKDNENNIHKRNR